MSDCHYLSKCVEIARWQIILRQLPTTIFVYCIRN